MCPVFSTSVVVLMLSVLPVQAELIEGKVHSINPEKKHVTLAETGIGDKGTILSFPIKDGVPIEEQVGEKRVPLPNGLKDIRVGDYLLLNANEKTGVTYVLRSKTDPRKK